MYIEVLFIESLENTRLNSSNKKPCLTFVYFYSQRKGSYRFENFEYKMVFSSTKKRIVLWSLEWNEFANDLQSKLFGHSP